MGVLSLVCKYEDGHDEEGGHEYGEVLWVDINNEKCEFYLEMDGKNPRWISKSDAERYYYKFPVIGDAANKVAKIMGWET